MSSPALRDVLHQLNAEDFVKFDKEMVQSMLNLVLVEGIKIGGIYEHFKGKEYIVKSVSRDCEDWDKFLVTYTEVTDARHEATRPVSHFLEDIPDVGPRFRLVG